MGIVMVVRSPRLAMLVLAVPLFFAVPVLAEDKPKPEPAKSTMSRIEKRTYDFKDAGKEMEYGLFVSTKYDKEKKAPLMIALHGLGSNPQQILRYTGLTDLAEKYGYVVAAPMGYNSQGWYGNKPPFGRKPDPENLYELSEKDVMNVIDIVRKEFNVDPNRIYLMGHSMGGGGTFHIGIKNPDLFAALAPIAPAIFQKPADLEQIKHVPIILVQGDKDNLVKVELVRPWADKMKELKMTYEYIEVPGGNHIDVAMKNMPKIFEFFNEHSKAEKKKE
jgi:poly(3-hydroxybutyrate) depolymerase